MSAEQRAKILNRRKATVFQKSGQDDITLFEQLKKHETNLSNNPQQQLELPSASLVIKTMNDKRREEEEESINLNHLNSSAVTCNKNKRFFFFLKILKSWKFKKEKKK